MTNRFKLLMLMEHMKYLRNYDFHLYFNFDQRSLVIDFAKMTNMKQNFNLANKT